MLRRSVGWAGLTGGTKMKALVIGVVLVFAWRLRQSREPRRQGHRVANQGYFGQDPIERRAFGESENGAEAEDSPLRFRLTP